MRSSRRGLRVRGALAATVLAGAVLAVSMPAGAGHGLASLTGSSFEIDDDANLKVDHIGMDDWASVTEIRQSDAPSGQGDDSYKGGAKEDDPCPATATGSIPNNKSDLLTFGTHVEGSEFLHLFWTRVQEPSGTTLMDFELNQSATDCGNGVNPVRTPGDLLIEYKIEQGGATATIVVRVWTGSAWGPEQDLTAIGAATGTINSSAIPASESDGLGAISPRTFGEATLDLSFILDPAKCVSFGSAFLKSRSSSAFNSALKDFIAPKSVQISNCGKVIIRKQTDPDGAAGSFGFTHDIATDPATAGTFQLQDDGVKTFNNVLKGSYTVTEDTLAAGFALDSIDCSASSSGVVPTTDPTNQKVTFTIDDASDVVDCTFTNKRQTGAIKVTKTRKHAASGPGDHAHGGVDFTVNGVTKATDANGVACFDGLEFGPYNVTETLPAGYVADGPLTKSVTVDNSATCTEVPYAGETVAFANTPLTDITVSVNSHINGGTFSTMSCVDDSTTPNMVADGSTGTDGDGSVTASNLLPGTYTCTVVVDP